jgi:Tfp pilus assembly protein PilF
MSVLRRVLLLLLGWCLLGVSSAARAGLYYSGEEMAPLPSQWRGFLLDQRQLRNVLLPSSPLRQRYQKAADDLEKAARSRKLSADEAADLGALYVRLGKFNHAVEALRAAQRQYPRHFHVAANLGTAFQMLGELSGAEACLREAVRLAPAKQRQAEQYHLDLVCRRLREGKGAQGLDDLFGVRFVNDKGEYEPGKLAAAQRKKLPAEAVACAQQLALWLPADGRLLWLLAELAGAHGDVRTAAAIMDGCVTEFGLRAPDLRRHRRLMREAAGKLAKSGPTSRKEHEGHAGLLKTRSPRPLVDRRAAEALPPIQPDGVNALPWFVLTQTSLDRRYRPTFPKYLRQLDGKRVTLTGYMQPLGDGQEMNSFLLIEYPVGCWYCETPELVAMVLVEMPPEQSHTFTREPVTVTGKLKLNATEPEDFLYAVRGAAVKAVSDASAKRRDSNASTKRR